jgi:hypothetical protein
MREFFGKPGEATFVWPRWLILRAIGAVFVLAFTGIVVEGRAIIGPGCIAPVSDYYDTLRGLFPNPVVHFLRSPGLFWISTGPAMITVLEWGGLAAAIALVLNLWPRMALFVCWISLLSFVSAWGIFSSTIIDKLMLETALLFIPFAPKGLRPGLGASSPPRPIAVFAVRFLLFRIMFESGIIKLLNGDIHWRDFSAMEVMYETSPLPTYLGYLDHQLPHAYHVFEILLTFAAEVVAPLAAVFGGRRWRWPALAAWTLFQAGIQLTTSFGWLNTAAIALGLLLLDDALVVSAARRLGLARVASALQASGGKPAEAKPPSWSLYGLRAFIGLQTFLGVYMFVAAAMGKTEHGAPSAASRPVDFVFRDFYSANAYIPYTSFPPAKYEVEFQGSNDGGKTWRTYTFRYKPQREDEICRHVAPWFDRFEACLQLAVTVPHITVIPRVAALLILRNPYVMALFKDDPFPDRPPTDIRMPVYQFSFTDLDTYRKTGRFWRKVYVTDYARHIYRNERGNLVQDP